MKAVRVHRFGGIDSLVYEEAPRPAPGQNQVLVHIRASGVGPWDALVREGQSALRQPLPLTVGSDLSGTIAEVGPGVTGYRRGDDVYGVTNPLFIGAYAEYAVADVGMIALKPPRLTHIQAASVPVVAVTADQMLFDHGMVDGSKRVLILGAAGNVGAYAVQLAKRVGATVLAAVTPSDVDYVRELGADEIFDGWTSRFEDGERDVDVVIDTVGGESMCRSLGVLKAGGVLVSSVTQPDPASTERDGVRGVYFIVDVTSAALARLGALLNTGELTTHVGDILPLSEARQAHQFLAGAPHAAGKIVLVADVEERT